MSVSFDLSEHERIKAWLRKKTNKSAVERGILAAAHRTIERINEIVDGMSRPPFDRGLYKAGWKVERISGGARVYNPVTHALFIEHGVRPENVKIGRDMIEALTAWVKRKGLVSGQETLASGKTRRLSRAQVLDECRKMAWAIAMNMKKKGIFGSGYGILKKAKLSIPGFVREEIMREMESDS